MPVWLPFWLLALLSLLLRLCFQQRMQPNSSPRDAAGFPEPLARRHAVQLLHAYGQHFEIWACGQVARCLAAHRPSKL